MRIYLIKRPVWLIALCVGFLIQPAWANDSNAALFQAAKSGNVAQVTALIANGADVNAKDTDGETPPAGLKVEVGQVQVAVAEHWDCSVWPSWGLGLAIRTRRSTTG
ncbi:MAG: ankyrin repeat domain-containing protein [Gammaproteobacteria bacterium]